MASPADWQRIAPGEGACLCWDSDRCEAVDWRERALSVEEAARRYLAAFDRWSDGIGQYLPGEDVTAYVKRRDAERVAANDARRALAALLPPR